MRNKDARINDEQRETVSAQKLFKGRSKIDEKEPKQNSVLAWKQLTIPQTYIHYL